MGDNEHLRGRDEPLSDQVGHGRGAERGGEVEAGWDRCPRGAAGGKEGFPCPEGPTHGEGSNGDGEVH